MTTEAGNNETVRVTKEEINRFIKQGYPVTCATCVHFHESRLKGAPTCGKTQCGGPVIGRDFPEYKGQISRDKFDKICLMCGDSNLVCHVVSPGCSQRFGLCEQHRTSLDGIVFNPAIDLPQNTPIIVPVK